MKLGDEHFQHAQGMHGAQGVRGVRAEQDFAEGIPEIGTFRDMDCQRGQGVCYAVFGGLGEGVAVSGHEGEDAQDGGRVVELGSGRDVDAAVVEQEVGACDGGSAAAELLVETDRGGKVLHQQRGAAVDDAGVAIVGAHPVSGIGGAAGLKADGVSGGFVLGLPVERIVVAAVAEVKETSCGGQEIEGCLGVAAGALEDAAALAGPLLGFLEVEQECEPDGQVVVAQAAGTLLQVGLEVENGVPELAWRERAISPELLGDGVPLAQHQAGQE